MKSKISRYVIPYAKSDGSVHQSGQISILFSFMIFMCVAVLTVILNIGQVLTYHGHLQTCTDCAAFSGAVLQARGLNQIASLNERIIQKLETYRSHTWNGGRPYSNKSEGQRQANQYKGLFQNWNATYNAQQRQINVEKAEASVSEAERVAKKNEPGIIFSVYSDLDGRLTELNPVKGKARRFKFRYYYYYWVKVGERWVRRRGIQTDSGPEVIARVYEKGTVGNTYFCARLLRPTKAFMFTMAGKLKTEFKNVRTYATAMPFGGNLWNGYQPKVKYDVKLVRTGAVSPLPPVPDSWAYEW
ncbi:MAG: hypothetical protein EOM12_04230 [Verrucomicrobiae bacterium]|nr:hypothetical protein [Verrucomicrobiae bacterium]